MTTPTYSYLALGDSYTIGEGVPVYDSFPYQAVQILRTAGIPFAAPEIIARTGWTTGELKDGIAAARLLPGYDFVTLLIGVNNEYRGRSLIEYTAEFEGLLRQAIGFAGDRAGHTFILSIPDWSVTTFAHANLPDKTGRSKERIAGEIDEFNTAAREIAARYQVDFIDITTHTRSHGSIAPARGMGTDVPDENAGDMGESEPDSWLAPDGLHPSGKEYRYWAEGLAGRISKYC
jgi:lysophospholipase L1-like esterase